MEFAYDGGGLGKGGTATLYIDGDPAGEGRIDQTEALLSEMWSTLWPVPSQASCPLPWERPRRIVARECWTAFGH